MRLLTTASSAVRAQQLALDTVADNLANVNTNGFKARQVDFAETLAQNQNAGNLSGQGTQNPGQLDIGAGAVYRSISYNLEQGGLTKTDSPWDLAIAGSGYFPVTTSNGTTAYTRDGVFRVEFSTDQQGQSVGMIVDKQGNRLSTKPQFSILEGDTNFIINQDGKVMGLDKDGKTKNFGQINLAQFGKAERLSSIGDNLLVPTAESGPAVEMAPGSGDAGVIISQSLELSNVNLATAMAELIQAQRAYQVNVRMIQNGDQMEAIANSLRR